MIPHPGLVQRLHRVGENAGSHHEDEQTSPAEKRAEVQTHAAGVDQPTNDDRQDQPEQGTDRGRRTFALLEHREQEEHRFQAFTRHGEKHHGDQRGDLMPGPGQRVIEGGVQRVLDRTRHFAHPEHHRTENADRHQADHAFKQFLLFLRKLGAHQFQATAHQQGEGGGEEHADPHGRHPLATAGLFEVAGDDANDQRSFNAFAQHDQKRNEHSAPCENWIGC